MWWIWNAHEELKWQLISLLLNPFPEITKFFGQPSQIPQCRRTSAPVQWNITYSSTAYTKNAPKTTKHKILFRFEGKQNYFIAPICALFKAYTGGRAWKEIGNRLLKPCYLSMGDHNWKIRTRKQRTDVGKYSFINRTIKSWNQLPAILPASFPCKLNTFRRSVKIAINSSEDWV
jgi:hypothetical protein